MRSLFSKALQRITSKDCVSHFYLYTTFNTVTLCYLLLHKNALLKININKNL